MGDPRRGDGSSPEIGPGSPPFDQSQIGHLSSFGPASPDGQQYSPLRQMPPAGQSTSSPFLASPTGQVWPPVPTVQCEARGTPFVKRNSWMSWILFTLSIFSTIVSGIYLLLAIIAPAYGQHVQTNGKLSASTAATLTTLFAKLVELSFVTLIMTYVGQTLTRNALLSRNSGITLAQVTLRNWVMQPGLIFTHFHAIMSTMVTPIGIVCVLATLSSILYTTAASALVAPKLRFLSPQIGLFTAEVRTPFANSAYLKRVCHEPKRTDEDGSTCLTMRAAARAFSDYDKFNDAWNEFKTRNDVDATDLSQRPAPIAMIEGSDIARGQWIEVVDTLEVSEKYGRTVNNVTVALPHAGVYRAAMLPINGVMQPEQLDGQGTYMLNASVPSPVLNVVCANLAEDELSPLVLRPRNGSSGVDVTNLDEWAKSVDQTTLHNEDNSIRTAVDDVFEWGPDHADVPPFFQLFPTPVNTILNVSKAYGNRGAYLLGRVPKRIPNTFPTQNRPYVLCKLQTYFTGQCSTGLVADSGRTVMQANCQNPSDEWTYNNQMEPLDPSSLTVNKDWPTVATHMIMSIALGDGISGANASIASLIMNRYMRDTTDVDSDPHNHTRVIRTPPRLTRRDHVSLAADQPSIAESLAAIVAGSLIVGTTDSAILPYWDHPTYDDTQTTLPVYPEKFKAFLIGQQYASGASAVYQKAFYPVLALVFCLNILVLAYMIRIFATTVTSAASFSVFSNWGGGFPGSSPGGANTSAQSVDNNGRSLITRKSTNSLSGYYSGQTPDTQYTPMGNRSEKGHHETSKGHSLDIIQRGFVVDMCEPQNLFSLAITSPPSTLMAGSCATGPESWQLHVTWRIRHNPETNHWFLVGRQNRRSATLKAVQDSKESMSGESRINRWTHLGLAHVGLGDQKGDDVHNETAHVAHIASPTWVDMEKDGVRSNASPGLPPYQSGLSSPVGAVQPMPNMQSGASPAVQFYNPPDGQPSQSNRQLDPVYTQSQPNVWSSGAMSASAVPTGQPGFDPEYVQSADHVAKIQKGGSTKSIQPSVVSGHSVHSTHSHLAHQPSSSSVPLVSQPTALAATHAGSGSSLPRAQTQGFHVHLKSASHHEDPNQFSRATTFSSAAPHPIPQSGGTPGLGLTRPNVLQQVSSRDDMEHAGQLGGVEDLSAQSSSKRNSDVKGLAKAWRKLRNNSVG